MYRRWLCTLFAVGILLALVLPAAAAEQGKIRILPHYAQQEISGGEVTLYRVGTAVEEGFRLTGRLANWIVREKDVFSEEFTKWILDRIYVSGTTLAVKKTVGSEFTGLQEGLYLAVQTKPAPGYRAFSPFLLTLPTETGEWEVFASPKVLPGETGDNPETGDHLNPIFGAMAVAASLLCLIILGEKRKK